MIGIGTLVETKRKLRKADRPSRIFARPVRSSFERQDKKMGL
jgi:hypothetical protein